MCEAGVRTSASKFPEAQPLQHCVTQTFFQGNTHLFQWESTEIIPLETEWKLGEGVKYVLLEEIIDGGVSGDKKGGE